MNETAVSNGHPENLMDNIIWKKEFSLRINDIYLFEKKITKQYLFLLRITTNQND